MSALGLDIGSKTIKLVQLDRRGGGWALLAAGITTNPIGDFSGGSDDDLVLVAEAVKKLVIETKVSSKKVIVSLPENKVFTPFLKLPYLTDQELESAIAWQAEPYIPIPVLEASIAHLVVDRVEAKAGTPGSVEVLLVAAPKALVGKFVKILELSALEVELVETELLALARSLAPNNQTVAILDIGGVSSSIGVVCNGQLVVGHSIATGADALTRAVATGLGMNLAQAEEYKKSYGLSLKHAEGRVAGVLVSVLRLLADEVKKTLQYYKNETGKEGVSALILSGGTAGLPELVPYLANLVGMEVLVGDPFARVTKDQKLQVSLSAYSPLYGVAVGLAME